jgi:hypothetical protein
MRLNNESLIKGFLRFSLVFTLFFLIGILFEGSLLFLLLRIQMIVHKRVLLTVLLPLEEELEVREFMLKHG